MKIRQTTPSNLLFEDITPSYPSSVYRQFKIHCRPDQWVKNLSASGSNYSPKQCRESRAGVRERLNAGCPPADPQDESKHAIVISLEEE
jgi:hypothetical protein